MTTAQMQLGMSERTTLAIGEALAGRGAGSAFARLRSALLFAGPAVVASIAYVDPGNFATNLQAGAQYGYSLLWVVLAAEKQLTRDTPFLSRSRGDWYLSSKSADVSIMRLQHNQALGDHIVLVSHYASSERCERASAHRRCPLLVAHCRRTASSRARPQPLDRGSGSGLSWAI